jgi:uncharacterized phage protein (TIGR01671 family)
MTRTIKFRAWDKALATPRMFDWLEITTDRMWAWFAAGNEEEDNQVVHMMQFTGLLDKNGKEIYEGDILGKTFRGKMRVHGEVTPTDGAVAIYGDEQGEHDGTFVGFSLPEDWERCEIIGNIYENPDLINPLK